MPYKRILVALDGSEMAERILPQVEELALKFGAVVVLARCTPSLEEMVVQTATGGATGGPPNPVLDMTPYVTVEHDDARRYLTAAEQSLVTHGVTVDVQALEGDPGFALVEYAQASGVDLIALTSHGRGGLERLVFGSVADRVLRHANCAVLVLPVHERRGQAPLRS